MSDTLSSHFSKENKWINKPAIRGSVSGLMGLQKKKKKSSACLQNVGLSSFSRRSDLFQQGRRGTTDLNKQLWVIRAGKANVIHKFWMAPTEIHLSAVKWKDAHDEADENLASENKYWI